MIKRTIAKALAEGIATRPVTLLTGARQTGKTTLVAEYRDKGFSYLTLDDSGIAMTASEDPDVFLQLNPHPLIIDEVQRAPGLFASLEYVVNKRKLDGFENRGMYILTGSQSYLLMRGVTESMAGRIAIIEMAPLSRSEILGRAETPFIDLNLVEIQQRANEAPWNADDLFNSIYRGFFPELYADPSIRTERFYEDYVSSYLERDISQLIKVGNIYKFRRFLEMLAWMTGQELVVDKVAKAVEIDNKTVSEWLGFLVAGHLVWLLQPYNEFSAVKRARRRPKLYFADTGLACHLARLDSAKTLKASFLAGPMVETYVVNEIVKSLRNNQKNCSFYYYRDQEQNEIDFVILKGGTLYPIEIKAGSMYDSRAVKSFSKLKSRYQIGRGTLFCNATTIYPIGDNAFAIPISAL